MVIEGREDELKYQRRKEARKLFQKVLCLNVLKYF